MKNKPTLMLAALAIAVASAGSAQAIEFTEVARLDVNFAFAADIGEQDPPDPDNNPKYIGTNPLAVAWDGSSLYLGGHDNFGSSLLPVGLIEVLNADSFSGQVTLGDSDFSDAFGQIFQPQGRGYTGLALEGGKLAASYDNGNNTANAIQQFDTAANTLDWDLSASSQQSRGGSGITFDPGFGGNAAQGGGVAWTTFGSGRRALNDTAGAAVYSLDGVAATQGMQWIPDATPANNFARDMAFDPDTGDVYIRRSNDIDAADRDGANSTTNRRTLVDNSSNGPFILGHKIEFLNDTDDGDLLIYNDSTSAAVDRAFADVVKVIDTAGAAQSPTFNLLNGEVLGDLGATNGIYDFDYDEASGTLAVLDFTNRNVHIFDVGAAVAGIDGDYNDDGSVDAADYTVWRDNLGEAIVLPNDPTPGTVDQGDYTTWANNYGMSSATSTAIPEPAALALAGLALAGAACGRRR